MIGVKNFPACYESRKVMQAWLVYDPSEALLTPTPKPAASLVDGQDISHTVWSLSKYLKRRRWQILSICLANVCFVYHCKFPSLYTDSLITCKNTSPLLVLYLKGSRCAEFLHKGTSAHHLIHKYENRSYNNKDTWQSNYTTTFNVPKTRKGVGVFTAEVKVCFFFLTHENTVTC